MSAIGNATGRLAALSLAFAAVPGAAYAAQASDAKTVGAVAAILGLGFGIVILLFVILFAVQAIFIWMAAGLVGLPQLGFGTAFRAAVYAWLLSIVFTALITTLSGFLPGEALGGGILLSVLSGTLGIKSAYRSDFMSALLAWFVSGVLAVIVVLGVVFALLMVSGAAAA
jgi:hypothetical protein